MSSLSMNPGQPKPPPDLSPWIVKLSEHYCDGGGYGDVWKCLHNRDSVSKEVAVKALRFQFMPPTKESNSDDKYVRIARRELGIWRRLDHKNVVPFLGIAYGFGPHVALVSLWMPHGTLRVFLAAHDQLAIFHRLQLLLDIAEGLLYLHSQPFVHGDLTSNNVLVDETYCARLADFGLASLVGEIPEGMAYLHASTMRTGTVRWAAPEHFSQDADKAFQRTTKTDIYSFGHIIFQMLSGKEPWSEIREDFRVVLCLSQGQRPARPLYPSIDNRHWDLVESCWRRANERPTANDVVLVLRDFLASCPAKVPLHELLRSPQVSRQNIVPQNQESSIEQMMHSPSSSEDHANVPRIFSRSHLTESLIAKRVAKLERISERRKTLLRKMYHMLQKSDNVGSVLTMDEIEGGDGDEDDALKQFIARFDLVKHPGTSILSDLPDSGLFLHSPPSPSELVAKKVEESTELDVDHPMFEPSASSTHINTVKQEDEEDAVMNGMAEIPEAVESPRRPHTPWARVTPVFVYPPPPSQTTPFIPPAPADVDATSVDWISYNPSSFDLSGSVTMGNDFYDPYAMPNAGWPYTPAAAAWPMAMPPQSPYGGYGQQWQYPTLQPPPMKVPGPPGDTSHAAFRWTNNADRVDPFTEGPHYGPVLEPFICKVVGAVVRLNPLLAPPMDSPEDYLRWNMLFHTSNCYRTTESRRSRIKGRNEPATHPRVTHIRIISRSFPWMINARAQNPKIGVTCEDVLNAISGYIHSHAKKEDYENMSSSRKREVRESYVFNRSSVPGKHLGEALKRIDWLGSATRFGGLVVDDGFVKECCGDVLPCVFELKCLRMYALTAAERGEVPYPSAESASTRSWP